MFLYGDGCGEGEEDITLLEGSQISPARPSHKGSMKIYEEVDRMLTVAG